MKTSIRFPIVFWLSVMLVPLIDVVSAEETPSEAVAKARVAKEKADRELAVAVFAETYEAALDRNGKEKKMLVAKDALELARKSGAAPKEIETLATALETARSEYDASLEKWRRSADSVVGVTTPNSKADEAAKSAEQDLKHQLDAMGFGVGLGAFVMSGVSEVKNAAPDNNQVLRVDSESRQRVGLVLETHYLWGLNPVPKDSVKRNSLFERVEQFKEAKKHDLAFGGSICVEVGSNGIRSAGIGPMISFRRYIFKKINDAYKAEDDGKPFNLGIYYVTEPRVKTLADDQKAGMVLASGTAIRFVDKPRNGFAIIFSVNL